MLSNVMWYMCMWFLVIPLYNDMVMISKFSFSLDVNFFELIQYRFRRQSDFKWCLRDIYDGTIYSERSDFFSSPYNISFTLNYDGAPKFKSSNMQIWPIQLCINELPPILRYMHLICVWLWEAWLPYTCTYFGHLHAILYWVEMYI